MDPRWVGIVVVLMGFVFVEMWLSRVKARERRRAIKGLVEERINFRLMVYGGIAGLDAPETAPVLALRAAVRQEKLFPVCYDLTPEEADRWVEQNLELMRLAEPQKVEALAAPERELLKRRIEQGEGDGGRGQ